MKKFNAPRNTISINPSNAGLFCPAIVNAGVISERHQLPRCFGQFHFQLLVIQYVNCQ